MRTLRMLVAGAILVAAGRASAQELQIREKTHLPDVEERILERVNEERAREGLDRVVFEPILAEVARNHTMEMLDWAFFEHQNTDGRGPSERVSRAHRTLVGEVAENIWKGNRSRERGAIELADNIMDGLMNSPGHRRNIMAPEMTHIGLGIYSAVGQAVRTNEIMVTQLLGAVRGYTRDPIQDSFMRNQTVRFQVRDLDGERARTRYFDLWSTEELRPVIPPTDIQESKVEAPPGSYQLRFLYPNEETGRLDAFSGPWVTIR